MYGEHLIDLDELVLRCRGERAKAYIAEAVACYRAGAYRACIVTTWIAVVFDFIDKIRELTLADDKRAQKLLTELEDTQRKNDVAGFQKFESEVLDKAKDEFELISPVEYDDLKRLRDDRNRCAHPSLLSEGEPYHPSGELARYHLRNAVLYLLQQPPVQGKAALNRIWEEIKSEYFPTNVNKAIEHFRHGPLARAREPLIRSVIIGLTKSLIQEHLPSTERMRQFAALKAVLQMYVGTSEKILAENLQRVVQNVADTELANVIEYIRYIPFAWQAIGEPGRIKAFQFIEAGRVTPALDSALYIPILREKALEHIEYLPLEILQDHVLVNPNRDYLGVVLRRLARARSYAQANELTKSLLLPLIPNLTVEDVKEIVNVAIHNDQVYDSGQMRNALAEIFTQFEPQAQKLKDIWIQLYTCREVGDWIFGGNRPLYSKLQAGLPIHNMIVETFPEVLALSEPEDF